MGFATADVAGLDVDGCLLCHKFTLFGFHNGLLGQSLNRRVHEEEAGLEFDQLGAERRMWLVKTGCRYIWQRPEALAARYMLCDNLRRAGYDPEEMVLGRIERDMDKYFTAFNLVNLNDLL